MTPLDADVLIIGSGPCGTHAAAAAVARGARVVLIDPGYEPDPALEPPHRPYLDLRRTDPAQRRYFLDPTDDLDAVARPGPQLMPPRAYATHGADALQPIRSSTFFPLQSAALGGLAAAWGAGCAVYADAELLRMGLYPAEMRGYYEQVVREIGVSGPAEDDLNPSPPAGIQPPLDVDSNAVSLLDAYALKRRSLIHRGLKLGRPLLAVLSRPLGDRQPNPYHDMDYYSDAGRSIYRPAYTLAGLARSPRFSLRTGLLAERFSAQGKGVEVDCRILGSGDRARFSARRLVLAAGPLNSARLVLRSAGQYGVAVPLLCNPYTYLAVLNLRMLGRPAKDRRHSLAQLAASYAPPDRGQDRLALSLFSYRSLGVWRVARALPLPPELAVRAVRLSLTALTLVGIHHPDTASPNRWVRLERDDAGEWLAAGYARSLEEACRERAREYEIARLLLQIYCLPLRFMQPPAGASLHYAGTLPFSASGDPLTCGADGQLHGVPGVYVADSATWTYLPAAGPTLTMMANARRVADRVVDNLEASA